MVEDRRSGPVSLGCGSLIVIGLIVLFFSGGGRIQDMEDELRRLRIDITSLRTVIEKQTREIQNLRETIDQQKQQP